MGSKTTKEHIYVNLCDLGFVNGISNKIPKHKQKKKKKCLLNLIKNKNFCVMKDTIKENGKAIYRIKNICKSSIRKGPVPRI